MISLDDNTTDLEVFASRMGLRGTDFDVFYEAYYSMDTEEIDEILDEWEAYWEDWDMLQGGCETPFFHGILKG